MSDLGSKIPPEEVQQILDAELLQGVAEINFVSLRVFGNNIPLPLNSEKLFEERTKARLFDYLRYILSHGITTLDELVPYLLARKFPEELALQIKSNYEADLFSKESVMNVDNDEYGNIVIQSGDKIYKLPLNPEKLCNVSQFEQVFTIIERAIVSGEIVMSKDGVTKFLAECQFPQSHAEGLERAYQMHMQDSLQRASLNNEFYGYIEINKYIRSINAQPLEN